MTRRLGIWLWLWRKHRCRCDDADSGRTAHGGRLGEKIKTLNLGVSYDFGTFKLVVELSQERDVSVSTAPVPVLGLLITREVDKYKGGLPGVAVPVGAGLIKGSFSRVRFDNDLGAAATPFAPDRDASVQKLAIGYEHNLSKRPRPIHRSSGAVCGGSTRNELHQ
ncbi:porin [Variovorax boronicumulans]|uniref:porin n=1 Tax=Variovorax boronicumulans TaxID=436515 RepID=UPI0027D880B1|nr:porin [Variovorax boronicumulans]